MQLLFIRKEIENKVVRDSELLKDAVQVAVSNCLGRHARRLWVRRPREYDDSVVSLNEIEEIREVMAERTPWTPWQSRGGG